MITYKLHKGNEVADIIKRNEERHFEDIKDKSLYSEKLVNWEIYEELGEEGLCYVVIAMDKENLVGYSCYTLTADLNKNNQVLAVNVALFIEREYRGRLVVEFINKCDIMLKELEVTQVLQSCSDVRIGKLLEKAGYNPRSITWCKTL